MIQSHLCTSPLYGDGEIAFDEFLDDLRILQELPQLERLHIGQKAKLTSLDLTGLSKLRSLHIEECHALEEVIGLDTLPTSCLITIEECSTLVLFQDL